MNVLIVNLHLSPGYIMAKEVRDVVSRGTLERVRQESADQLERLRKKLKAASDGANSAWSGGASETAQAVIVGAASGALSKVAPVTLPVVGEVSGGSLAFSAAWPFVRKGLSNKLRGLGDKLFFYSFARAADDGARKMITSYMS